MWNALLLATALSNPSLQAQPLDDLGFSAGEWTVQRTLLPEVVIHKKDGVGKAQIRPALRGNGWLIETEVKFGDGRTEESIMVLGFDALQGDVVCSLFPGTTATPILLRGASKNGQTILESKSNNIEYRYTMTRPDRHVVRIFLELKGASGWQPSTETVYTKVLPPKAKPDPASGN
jgi:hypothetical protein